jgi:hypothetical protein
MPVEQRLLKEGIMNDIKTSISQAQSYQKIGEY